MIGEEGRKIREIKTGLERGEGKSESRIEEKKKDRREKIEEKR